MPTRFLAEYHGLKPAYLAKAMQKLSTAQIITSTEGRVGGLALARAADSITVLQIVEALEGSESFFRCTEIRQQGPCAAVQGNYRSLCKIACLMRAADAAWRNVLAQTTLDDLKRSVEAEPVEGVMQATIEWIARTGAMR